MFYLRLGGLVAAFFLMSGGGALALPSATADNPTSDVGNPNAGDRIRAVAQTAARIFVGGDFTAVDGTTKRFVAALDASGNLKAAWRGRTNGRVYALALSASGSRLFIGGRFTKVNGVGRKNLAAVSAKTGRVIRSWRAGTNGTSAVRTIARRKGVLYIGGDFTHVRGKHRVRLASVTVKSGRVRRWRPLANRPVRALALRGSRVYAGGAFTKVARRPGATLVVRNHFVSLSRRTGAIGAFDPNLDSQAEVNAIATAVGRIYLGTGGETCTAMECNSVLAFATADDSAPVWDCGGDGDVHALIRSGNVLYAGGHWADSGTNCLNLRALMAIDRSNGQPTAWNPRPNMFGVLALSAWQGTRLAVGGLFSRVSAQDHDNYAQFTGNPGDLNSP